VEKEAAIAAIRDLIKRCEQLAPDTSTPEFTQWRTVTSSRMRQLLPQSSALTRLSLLRFHPSDAEYFNAMSNSSLGVDPIGRFEDDRKQAIALLNAAIEEIEFDEKFSETVTDSATDNKSNTATSSMLSGLQRRALNLIWDRAIDVGRWPTFIEVDWMIDKAGLGDSTSLLQAIPAGYVLGVNVKWSSQISDQQIISLTVAGAKECTKSGTALLAFEGAVRLALEKCDAWEPTNTNGAIDWPRFSSSELSEAIGKDFEARIRQDDSPLRAVGLLVSSENGWFQGFNGEPGGAEWSVTLDPKRARQFRGVTSIEDYLARRKQEEPDPFPSGASEAIVHSHSGSQVEISSFKAIAGVASVAALLSIAILAAMGIRDGALFVLLAALPPILTAAGAIPLKQLPRRRSISVVAVAAIAVIAISIIGWYSRPD
jgi:hypothetical protein